MPDRSSPAPSFWPNMLISIALPRVALTSISSQSTFLTAPAKCDSDLT
jgi:hypothetical protein